MNAQQNDEIRDVLKAGRLVELGLKLPEILVLQALYAKRRQISNADIQAVAEKLQMSETLVRYHHREALAQVKRCQFGRGMFAEMFGTGSIDKPGAPAKNLMYEALKPLHPVVEVAIDPLICRADYETLELTYTRPEFHSDEERVAFLSQEYPDKKWSLMRFQRYRTRGLRILADNGISVYHCLDRVFAEIQHVQDGGNELSFVVNLSGEQRKLRLKAKRVVASLGEKELLVLHQRVHHEVSGQSVTYKVIAEELNFKLRTVHKYVETINQRLADRGINPWTVLVAHANDSPGQIVKD